MLLCLSRPVSGDVLLTGFQTFNVRSQNTMFFKAPAPGTNSSHPTVPSVRTFFCYMHFQISSEISFPQAVTPLSYTSEPHSREFKTQKLKSHLMRTQSLKVLPFKSRVGQYIAMYATLLPGISSLLISTLPVHSPAFCQNLSRVLPVLVVANTGSCVGPQNKIGHPAECRFPC